MSMFASLGFTDKEQEIYEALYRYGASAASTLSRLTGIKRSSVYDILTSLLERNLIVTIKQGSTTTYAIDDLNKLVHEEKNRVRIAEELVQHLKNTSFNPQEMQVHYYRGTEGFREMYEDILRAKTDEIMAWVNLDTFYSGLDMEREDEWTRERVAQKTKARLIMTDTPSAHTFQTEDKKNYRETRILPKGVSFATTCFLYDGYVTYFSSTKPISGVRISNPDLFQMQKTFFDMQWAAANN